VKREIALGPATVFLALANESVFHFDFPLVASRINSSFVWIPRGVAIAELRDTECIECGMIASDHRLTESFDRLRARLLIRRRGGPEDTGGGKVWRRHRGRMRRSSDGTFSLVSPVSCLRTLEFLKPHNPLN
jgi:hypothetical protein